MYGRNLQALVKQAEQQAIAAPSPSSNNTKKRNKCFLTITNRTDIINSYEQLFYCRYPPPKTKTDFKNLCVRVRDDRFQNRLKFSYLVVKNLKCTKCNNKCIYDALKTFYKNEKKCVAEVDRLISKEC
ncbi:LEF-2 [Epinotia aporema granulovirus]|uniref:LEF-2 n=1 Tax=Epinotia aporema granulovirus TaxID=166056 RepID=K4EQ19_9BBAC|nr:LEF-2 [Epinotia aporema granulovirus]AER41467.1 LEF-2 [Epinotia aporema granulovirus]